MLLVAGSSWSAAGGEDWQPGIPTSEPAAFQPLIPTSGPVPPASGFQRLPALTDGVFQPSRVEFARYDPPPPGDMPPVAPPMDAHPIGDAYAEPPVEYYSVEEMRDEMRDLAWVKGDYKIVPYGILWGSAIYSNERAAPGPFITHIFSPAIEGEDDFVIDTRRTRLGFNVTGPQIPMFACASSSAQVEIDFHGVTGTVVGNTVAPAPENRAAVLLRHAWADIKNDNFRLMAGQGWDVISPLNPGMLNYAVGWGGGNIGFRRMQVRFERYLHVSDSSLITLQGALAQDIITDFAPFAESANWPVLEGRCAWTLGPTGTGSRPLTVGVSGHLGEQGFDFPAAPPLPAVDDERIITWSFNADARWPITERLGVQGEFFTGRNLSTFLGGSLQGLNPLTRNGIQATGGWIDLWYDWTPRLHNHLGYGVDDPVDADIAPGGRTRNGFVFTNLSYDVTPKLSLGLEVSYWETRYAGLPGGDAMVFEFAGAYGF